MTQIVPAKNLVVLVAGIDGCRGGWVVVESNDSGDCRIRIVKNFQEVLSTLNSAAFIGVDMPIGLPTGHSGPTPQRGRACDRDCRKLLGWKRGSSVFSPPSRAALASPNYSQALRVNREHTGVGISKQAFNLFPKILEIDSILKPTDQKRIREVHPELSFWRLNGECPLAASKRTPEGLQARCDLLRAAGFQDITPLIRQRHRRACTPDDIADAAAACWSAWNIAHNQAMRLPCSTATEHDAKGLAMEIWA